MHSGVYEQQEKGLGGYFLDSLFSESGVANKYVNSPANTARACTSFIPPYTVKVNGIGFLKV
jgi:hypothetical protein